MLQRLLHEDSVLVALEAPNREAVLAEMVARIPASALASKKKAQILDLMMQRERFGTTAIGEGVALPHCVHADVPELILCLGVSRKGVDYAALDGQPVHLIFMVIFPESYLGRPERHRLLQEAEMILRDRFLKERLKVCETSEEAYGTFIHEAQHLVERGHLDKIRTSA